MGAVMEGLGLRKAELQNMIEMAGYLRMEFLIPARGLIGFRNQFLTDTKGNGIMNTCLQAMRLIKRYSGPYPRQLVAFEAGETTSYGISNAQERGTMFIVPGEQVYEGQIIGENSVKMIWTLTPARKNMSATCALPAVMKQSA